jgi:hypothetical protein
MKCPVQYKVCLQCIFFSLFLSLSPLRMKVRDFEVFARVRGQRKISQVVGAFELMGFTMSRTVLAWHVF